MNWIKNVVRPKIQKVFQKKDMPNDLWKSCKGCGSMLFVNDLKKTFQVCPECGHHMPLPTEERFRLLFGRASHDILPVPQVVADPLRFRDQKRYRDRLRDARQKTGAQDAVTVAHGAIGGVETIVAVQDFSFMGGSLGMAAGEAIVMGAEKALEQKAPYLVVTSSGGARMQEGILSLMQLPRTLAAIQSLREKSLPYLVLLAHPTTGGVTASYGMMGDVHIAEPGALIGFAGPRVIEQTIRQKLPDRFQSAEYLLEHGMVDMVTPRKEQHALLERLLRLLLKKSGRAGKRRASPQAPAPSSS